MHHLQTSFIKKELTPLLKLALPLTVTAFSQSGAAFFETIFLAHLGPKILAAGALVAWLFGVFASAVFGSLNAINVLTSHKHGAGDKESISLIARDGLLLAALLLVPTFLLFWNMSPIFLLFGQPESVVVLANAYLHALSWGLFAMFASLACLEITMGIGHVRITLVFSMATCLLSIFFSYLLIFGKFGLPALGIAGAGWGMTISFWINTIFLMLFILTHKHYRTYFTHIFKFKKPSFLIELIQVGVPIGAMFCVEVTFFFALTLSMGLFGNQIQAANQVALQYLGIFMSMMFAIAQAATIRMGHLLGAGDSHFAERTGMIGMSIAILCMSIVAIFFWATPGLLISIDFDINNPNNFAIVNEIKKFLAISALFQILESARIVLFGLLRGLKDTRFTLFTSIISFWGIALPLGYFLAQHLHLGGQGFWYAMIVSVSFSIFLLFRRFKSKVKNFKKSDRIHA
jgi:MATE family multidrug resistance protein